MERLARWSRRIARTARGVHPSLVRPDDAWAHGYLVGPENRLYDAMDPRDRDHAVRVARRLLASYPGAPTAVVRAALLHDVGKSRRRYSVAERIAVHLAKRMGRMPSTYTPNGVRMLDVAAWHAAYGADAIRAVGGDPLVASLVARHEDPGDDPWAARLRDADAAT